ncbi:hypothetical protein [Bartonella machadoae]|nr:hypothetical protein [Bartonella machadoae]
MRLQKMRLQKMWCLTKICEAAGWVRVTVLVKEVFGERRDGVVGA